MNDLPVSLHVPQGADRHGVEPFAETRTARAVIEHNSGPELLAGRILQLAQSSEIRPPDSRVGLYFDGRNLVRPPLHYKVHFDPVPVAKVMEGDRLVFRVRLPAQLLDHQSLEEMPGRRPVPRQLGGVESET